jgi:hypothetical protein
MNIVLALALALSAAQVEEIIVHDFHPSQVFQVVPPSHPAVAYEWRIEGVGERRGLYLAHVGEQILKALGTSRDTKWKWGGLMFEGRDPWEELTDMAEMMGKKSNVGFVWDLETQEGRLFVFDPETMADYMNEPAD